MKKYLLLLLVAAQSTFAFAQKDNETPYLTKSLSDASIKKIEAETSGGNISVAGVGSNARIEVYIHNNNGNIASKAEIEERLKNYELTVEASGNKLTAIAKNKDHKWDWKKSLSISFKIYVPKNVSSDLETSGGNINLNDLEGDQKFTTSGGNLVIDNISGDIDGRTSGGNIIINHSHENINLATSGGNIEAADCNGKINMSTSGGNVRLNDLKGNIKTSTSGGNIKGDNIEGTLSAQTSGGNVNLDGISGSLEAATSGGSMNVQIVKLGDYVRVNNSGGSIDLQLPKDKGMDLHIEGDKIKVGTMYNFSGNTEDDKIDGKLNGGGVSVVVKTSGRVNLSLQ